MRGTFKGRIELSSKACEAISFMIGQLKEENPHIQLSQSKFSSWIIENYVRNHFSSEHKKILAEHFNTKRYLAEMLKRAKSEEEIREILKTAQGQLGSPSNRSSRRTKAQLNEISKDAPNEH